MEPIKGQRLKELINEYVIDYSTIERGFTPKTIKGKRLVLEQFRKFLGDREMLLETCREYQKDQHGRGLKPNSIRANMKVVKAFINYLHDREHLEVNYAHKIKIPKFRQVELEIIPAKLAEELIITGSEPGPGDSVLSRHSKKEHREALQFVLRTGLRVSELIKLKTRDINLEDETFKVNSKGGKIDVLPLPKDQLKVLKRRCRGSGKVFKVNREMLNKTIKRGAKRVGIESKLSIHSMRHIFCTSLLKNGVPLQIVSRLMRHSSIKITDSVYSHYIIEDLSLALNSKHPLVAQGLTPLENIKMLNQLIIQTGILDNTGLKSHLKFQKNKLNISIELSD